jgi:amino acid adenylation domain-containing protein
LVAALKAGAAYIPLDPAYPKERLALMAEDAGLSILLTQSHLVDRLPAGVSHAVTLDTFDWDQSPSAADLPAVSPNDLAYVVYTSGSTGKPKGVAIEHRSLVNLLCSFGRELGFSEQDHLLATSTLSFDMGNLDVFLPLFYGAAFTLVSRDVAMDSHRLAEAIAAANATYMQATPATFRMLLDSNWQGKADLRILSGGENLTRDLVDRLREKCSGIWNGYGPAEATICSAMAKVELGEGPVPIGVPLANTLLYVLDAEMQPVPAAVRGELYIGGAGLARQYLNRPELTAERFIQNPFGEGRLYKTGDVVRWRNNGQLEFMGRSDDQVKLRGFRIELGEIEAAIVGHANVTAACVTLREDQPGESYLAGYYVAEPGTTLSGKDLREYARSYLPAHMVPSRWLALERLPLTPNGKVDRKALPVPPAQLQAPEVSGAGRTPMQNLVAAVWESTLGIQGIGVHDNFYDLGGHSLLSMQVIQELEKRTGARVQPTALVTQSLGQVAAFYERHSKGLSDPTSLRKGPKRERNWGSWNQRLTRGVQRLLGIEGSQAS